MKRRMWALNSQANRLKDNLVGHANEAEIFLDGVSTKP